MGCVCVGSHEGASRQPMRDHAKRQMSSAPPFSDGVMKDIDKYTSRECFSHLRCLPALPLRRRGAFGCGLFSQDRHAVEPWRGQEYIRVGQ